MYIYDIILKTFIFFNVFNLEWVIFMSEQYIDFEGTCDQLKTFIKELYNLNETDADLIATQIYGAKLKTTQTESDCFDVLEESDDENETYKLYFRDTRHHIRVHKIIIDFMASVAVFYATNEKLISPEIISSIWNVLSKNIIKIKSDYFCIYLKIYYYGFTNHIKKDELFSKFKISECDVYTKLFNCNFRDESTCNLTEEQFNSAFSLLINDGIVEEIDSDYYRLTK